MAGISEEQPAVSDEPAQARGPGRPFRPGQSGNPSGRPKSLAALEAQIRELHGPLAIEVLEKLRGLALAGNVAAAKVYLERVLGPSRAMREPLPSLPSSPDTLGAGVNGSPNPIDQDELEVTKRILRVIAGQVAALEAKAADVGLVPEESAALAAHLSAVSGIGKWHLRKLSEFEEQMAGLPADQAKATAERMLCEELGITVEQLQELRASRPA
jgi:hypothetical protein